MAEDQQQTPSGKPSGSSDSDVVLELNFVPQWARKPPGSSRYGDFDDRGGDRPRRGGRRGGPPGGGRERGGRDSRDRRPRRDDRGPRRDSRDAPGGGQPRFRQGPSHEAGADSHAGPHRGPRPPRSHEDVSAGPAPVGVRFLPEQQALVGLVRQVSGTKRAYPLLDLAALLMSKPGFCFVKLEVNPEIPDLSFYQCKICRTVSMDREQIEAHVLSDHVGDYFDVEETEGDAPTGTFVCVAKCGLSGALLGPPNHHSYGETVRRMHASRFAHMDLNAYKDRIKLSHDPEDVERWKTEAARKTVYRPKQEKASEGANEGASEEASGEAAEERGGEDSNSLTQAEAERYLRAEALPKNVNRTKRVVVSEDVAHEIKDLSIKRALRDEWQRESRFPLRLSFALRAAFKHKHLHVFKAGKGKGVNFVTSVPPVPLDPDVAIPSIHDVLLYLNEHPGCTRQQMVEALRPGEDPESDAVKELLQPLHWLVERGHIIEFFNGALSVPLSRR